MITKPELRIYGENAATFLIFHALAKQIGAIDEYFIARLKRFDTGRKQVWPLADEVRIWLFPSFGKRHGFGEPDALVLYGDQVFWIEVETSIRCNGGMPALRHSLLQMWRFMLFQRAVSDGVINESGARRIKGVTLTDSRQMRTASIRLAGHGVLKEIRKCLKTAGRNCKDHYVLFSVDKPAGEGVGRRSYARALADETTALSSDVSAELPRLPLDRCWYIYWNGDMTRALHNSADITLGDGYVRIRRSR